jgi:microcin C transport system permease protein
MKTQGLFLEKFKSLKKHPRAFVSFVILATLLIFSLLAGLFVNSRPYYVKYNGEYYFPLLKTYPETTFGGIFEAETNYQDAFFKEQMAQSGNFALFPPVPWDFESINGDPNLTHPSPPSSANYLGTDNRGRDILARLVYGFRVTLLFALGLACLETFLGILIGSLAGYFGGWVDLLVQRFMEIWASIPMLYLLIFFFSIFTPSQWLILLILGFFGWMEPQNLVRVEFLKSRNLDYVKAARAIGVHPVRIILRHILPNALTMVVTRFPFSIASGTTVLVSLDFLGLGVPPPTPSLGELLNQAVANLNAWWIGAPTFAVLVMILVLVTFIGEAILDVFDPRRSPT